MYHSLSLYLSTLLVCVRLVVLFVCVIIKIESLTCLNQLHIHIVYAYQLRFSSLIKLLIDYFDQRCDLYC